MLRTEPTRRIVQTLRFTYREAGRPRARAQVIVSPSGCIAARWGGWQEFAVKHRGVVFDVDMAIIEGNNPISPSGELRICRMETLL